MAKHVFTGEVCCNCKRERKDHFVEWAKCQECGNSVCNNCAYCWRTVHADGTATYSDKVTCRVCSDNRWKEYRKKERLTPVECSHCHKEKLPRYFYNTVSPSICKRCKTEHEKEEQRVRKRKSIPGRIEVVYGIQPIPKKDGGSGYSYESDEKVNVGDIVRVPATWLSPLKSDRHLATVVSTYSDYTGPVSKIRRVVTKVEKRIEE